MAVTLALLSLAEKVK